MKTIPLRNVKCRFARAITIAGIAALFAPISFCTRSASGRSSSGEGNPNLANKPECSAKGKEEITIECEYAIDEAGTENRDGGPRIFLKRMELSFKTRDENYMRTEFDFANTGNGPMTKRRTAYLEIDDALGQNHVRRPLPQVDFAKLSPGTQKAFSESLLVAAFRPGRYTIYLWIPDSNPSEKFDPAKDFLLSNSGIPNQETGLNELGMFEVLP